MIRRAGLLLLLAAAARADRVVERDGRILKGGVEIRKEDALVVVGRRKLPLAQVYLAETDEGSLIYAPDFEARVRGYEYLAHDHLRDEYVKLVRECVQVGDTGLARVLLEKAEQAGLSSREAAKIKLKIRKSKRAVQSDRLQAEADELRSYFGELLAQRAQREYADGRDAARLLRAALDHAPRSKLGLGLLGERAPKAWPIGDARQWLAWHVDIELSGAKLAPAKTPALRRARKAWRSDLHAVRTPSILVITPVVDSRIVGRCLAYGRLGCGVLAKLFKTDKPARNPQHPLTVFLYENQHEYQTVSGTGEKIEDPAFLKWTAGHYSPSEGISRFFWFSNPDAERRIVGTCIHELTHHWLEERNPRVVPAPGRVPLPGFWIIEGFATFMEEGLYDIDSGEWDLFNPRARSLDVMQSIGGSKRLIPWNLFYAITNEQFHMLPPDDELHAVLRWQLYTSVVSTRRLFYEQAGATCQYLFHAEGGKYRAKLLDYVCDYYAGREARLLPKAAFGMSAEQLGRRTVAFAQQVARGWKPKRK